MPLYGFRHVSSQVSNGVGVGSFLLLKGFKLEYLCTINNISLCLCPSVPSYLRQFRMYGAKLVSACPETHGGSSYINTCSQLFRVLGYTDLTKEPMWTFEVDYVAQMNMSS